MPSKMKGLGDLKLIKQRVEVMVWLAFKWPEQTKQTNKKIKKLILHYLQFDLLPSCNICTQKGVWRSKIDESKAWKYGLICKDENQIFAYCSQSNIHFEN